MYHAGGLVGMSGRGLALYVLAVALESDMIRVLRDCVDCGWRTGQVLRVLLCGGVFPERGDYGPLLGLRSIDRAV